MTDVLWEPGFWAIAFLLGSSTSALVGAAIARSSYRELNARALAMLGEADASDPTEREAVRSEVHKALHIATTWYYKPLLVVGAPFYSVYMLCRVLWSIFIGDAARFVRHSIKIGSARSYVMDVAYAALFRSAPLMTFWVMMWLFLPTILSLPFDGRGDAFLKHVVKAFSEGRRIAATAITSHAG